MASRLGRQLARTAQVCRRRNAVPTRPSLLLTHLRSFHSSPPALAARRSEELLDDEDMEELLADEYDDDDSASAGHMMLREHRQTLYYLRLIEHEMPKLVGPYSHRRRNLLVHMPNLPLSAFRKPFEPLKSDALIVRSIDYGGEDHPAIKKRVVTVAVDSLPLRDQDAVHKFKLLAGPRWTLRPPTDGGVSGLENWGNGFVKISCEDFPQPSQNLKWISDTLDKLIEEANDPKDKFKDVPLEIRHIYSKARKAKKGEHLRGRLYDRPTIHDFPQEWLPDPAPSDTHSQ
ncbi:37S ribosomal protein S24, mitochondrial [Marasmius crinis-equi]|uniref:37S ribosomal protein S24, mitochondrial n=1 Tax=Marasmius crinis-equi TaxID=585013 RepID=A0ABR3FKA7_9AGAR